MARLTVAIVSVALALAACMSPPIKPTQEATPHLVWPPAPDQPRVQFVRTFSSAEDLGIAKSFLARLKDIFFGEEETRLVRPMAVVAVGGVLYVADPGAKGVHRFDVAGGDYRLIRGPDDLLLPSPVGLAAGSGGEVYVTDSKLGQVLVIRADAKVAVPLPLGESLGQPTGIAFDPAGRRLYVTDTAAHRVDVFGRDGRLETTIGRRGVGDGEFNYPTLLWRTPAGKLYVTDSLNYRIEAFDEQGRFLAKFGRQGDGSGDAARPKGVAADRFGHLYVVDGLFHAVQIFDEAGKYLLAVGQQGQEPGEFWLPAGIFIGDDDSIYVADAYNRRVQVLRYVGGPR